MELKIRCFKSDEPEFGDYIADVEGWDNHFVSAFGDSEFEAIKELCVALMAMIDVAIEDGENAPNAEQPAHPEKLTDQED